MLPLKLLINRSSKLSSIASKLVRESRRLKSGAPAVREPHMNDIPIPHEPFEVGFGRRQRGNNAVLIIGLAFFATTVTYVVNSGVIFFNLTPPKKNLELE